MSSSAVELNGEIAAAESGVASPSQLWLRVADALVLGVLASASLWQLFEMDVFWALRAGREIVETAAIPMTETWSYTVSGSPWLNTHWLTELISYLAFSAGGVPALVALRAFVVAVWLTVLLALVRSTEPAGLGSRAIDYAVVALAFVASTYRLELRGELFVLIAFAVVLWLWIDERPKRELWTALSILVAANFHAGQAVMVLALGLVMLGWERGRDLRSASKYAALMVAAFIATPVHVRVIGFVLDHLFYHSNLTNPDHQPLRLALFNVGSGHGISYWVWIGLSVLAVAGLRRGLVQGRTSIAALLLPLGALTWLCLDRVRAVPFAVTMCVPLAALALGSVRNAKASWSLALTVAAATASHAWLLPRPYGFRIDERVFPVQAARFIKETRPAGNLYHTFTFGAYLVWGLPSYKVFGDTRETPFRELTDDYLAAYASPAEARKLQEQFGVNAVLVPIPGTERIEDIGWRDVHEEFAPRREWALVYFDNISLLMVRRVPKNAELVQQHEYTMLRPNVPPFVYPKSSARTPEKDVVFQAEVRRCRQRDPHNEYCEFAEAMMRQAR